MEAEDIWDNYLRYIGAGAVAFGGIMGLIKSLPTIASSFAGSLRGFSGAGSEENLRTDRDMSMPLIIILTVVFIGILLLYPAIDIGIIGIRSEERRGGKECSECFSGRCCSESRECCGR